jgi:hypothetical protein
MTRPWRLDHSTVLDNDGNPVAIIADPAGDGGGERIEWPWEYDEAPPASYAQAEDNARLIAAAPAMLEAIETAGRIVGQVQDNPKMSADERAYALSRASDALGGTYFKTTGKPLEWWQLEPAIAKATTGQEEL